MKLWKTRLTALLLCLIVLTGLALNAAAMAPVDNVANSATHLRTSYNDSNYLDLTISGDTLTVNGKLQADRLRQIKVQVGSASRTVDAVSGQLFSVQLTLTHSGSTPVKVYTKTAGTAFSGVTWHSIYIQKTSGGYEILESQVLDNNLAFAASAIDPQDAFRIQVPDSVAAKSDEIVGGETDDYTKVFLLYQWVTESIYYDYDAYYDPDLRTINTATVLDQRRGVCAGYAALLRDLILAQGIPAIYCSNLSRNSSSYALTASGGESHAHTEAYVNGRWIVMDATWDSNNEYHGGSYQTETPNGFYYFDITPEAFALDHKTTSRDQKDYVVADDGFGYSTDGKTIVSYDGPGGDVVIPEGVTAIGDYAFLGNGTITSLTVPSSVRSIGRSAFEGCYSLTSVTLSDGLTSIGESAFSRCWRLTNLRLPAGSVTIGDFAFSSSAITEVTISGGTRLDEAVFSDCEDLRSVVFESGITSIPYDTFNNCWSITAVELPATVTSIAERAFVNCIALKQVYFGGSESQWAAISIGEKNDSLTKATVHFGSTMPGEPEQAEEPEQTEKPEEPTQETVVPDFQDVPENSWYTDAVAWAVAEGITNGTSNTTFSPNQLCQRSQILTFLWRALDCPVVEGEMPFRDVNMDLYFGEAARWAAVTGVAEGDMLYPFDPCTRADAVEFLWRALGSPEAGGRTNFTDVPADAPYTDAVAWAVAEGITNGTGADTFSPNATCTRAQIVTLLCRALDG